MPLDFRNRPKMALIGLAIGDAFATSVEFMDNGSFLKVEI